MCVYVCVCVYIFFPNGGNSSDEPFHILGRWTVSCLLNNMSWPLLPMRHFLFTLVTPFATIEKATFLPTTNSETYGNCLLIEANMLKCDYHCLKSYASIIESFFLIHSVFHKKLLSCTLYVLCHILYNPKTGSFNQIAFYDKRSKQYF